MASAVVAIPHQRTGHAGHFWGGYPQGDGRDGPHRKKPPEGAALVSAGDWHGSSETGQRLGWRPDAQPIGDRRCERSAVLSGVQQGIEHSGVPHLWFRNRPRDPFAEWSDDVADVAQSPVSG